MFEPFVDTWTAGETIRFEVKDVLLDARSQFQHIRVLDLVAWGRSLVLDDDLQSTEADEHLYHEALVQPALLALDDPGARSVLVLGGGEGATAREALKHRSVERVVMVDLDKDVVDACRRHLPNHHRGAFADPRFSLVVADAARFLATTRQRFDCIVFDLVDPAPPERLGPAQHLFQPEFFASLREHLAPGGLLAMQYGPTFVGCHDLAASVVRAVRAAFPAVAAGQVSVPSFHGSWGVLVAGERVTWPDALEIDARIARRLEAPLKAVDGAALPGIFALPKDLRERLDP